MNGGDWVHAKGSLAALLVSTLLLAAGCAAAHTAAAPHSHGDKRSINGKSPVGANGSTAGRAGSGPSASGVSPPPAPTMVDVGKVNGCDAANVFFECFSQGPFLIQGSPAAEEWSHLIVGETIDLTGAVPMYSNGKPSYQEVYMRSPSGKTVLFPVDAQGGFSGTYTFAEQGIYTTGGGTWSDSGPGNPFWVVYKPEPPQASLLSSVFPASLRSWPDITVVAVPFGQTGTLRVRFVNAQGDPASNVSLDSGFGTPLQTDAQGYASVPYDTTKTIGWPQDRVYGSLFLQTVLRLTVEGDRLRGLWVQTPFPAWSPVTVPVRVVDGVPFADAEDFLGAFASVSAKDGTLTLQTGGQTVRIDGQTGGVNVAPSGSSAASQVPETFRVAAMSVDGRLYLSLADLSKIVNLFAWAQIEADGSMLVAEPLGDGP